MMLREECNGGSPVRIGTKAGRVTPTRDTSEIQCGARPSKNPAELSLHLGRNPKAQTVHGALSMFQEFAKLVGSPMHTVELFKQRLRQDSRRRQAEIGFLGRVFSGGQRGDDRVILHRIRIEGDREIAELFLPVKIDSVERMHIRSSLSEPL